MEIRESWNYRVVLPIYEENHIKKCIAVKSTDGNKNFLKETK